MASRATATVRIPVLRPGTLEPPDPILKERLFGLTNPQGNHGEDVKECYYHLDASPTNSYLKALYKYPQAEFPYEQLISENKCRGPRDQTYAGEFEVTDTVEFHHEAAIFRCVCRIRKGVYPNDILIRIANRVIANRSCR